MSTFVSNNVSSGAIVFASDHNEMGSRIAAVVNGGLDDNNISSLSGTKVVAGTLPSTALDSNLAGGWQALGSVPSSVTYNGNRSYSLVFNSVDLTGTVSNGMRLKFTRSVSAPTQCTSLNGSTQYYSKTSPAAMTFTDDFVVGAWVKLTSYATATVISRYNGTSGWLLEVGSSGTVVFTGVNAGSANFSRVASTQSIPLNKWVHIAAQLDMSTFTATTTTSYIMIDGVDVPASVSRGGTNPTALVQAGNLEIGSVNGGTEPFPGKIAQAAVFNAKVTQATMRGYASQGLAGTETSLISAYSFNNSINDLNTTNANNLTANGSAVATNADSPFTQDDTGTPLGTTDLGIITGKTFSTNTTLTVQVPEGCTIPTTGGVSAVSYSTQKTPYGFPAATSRWIVSFVGRTSTGQTTPTNGTWYNPSSQQLNVPVGAWRLSYEAATQGVVNGNESLALCTLSTSPSSESDIELSAAQDLFAGSTTTNSIIVPVAKTRQILISTATPYYLLIKVILASQQQVNFRGDLQASIIRAECAYL